MPVHIPFLKMRVPELESLAKPQRQEILARCAEDPSMRALVKQHMILTRVGQAILAIGLIAYFILSRTGIDWRIIVFVQVGAMVLSVACIAGSVLLYHHRTSRQLRLLVRATLGREG
jgi:hypothetical protein